ncbi:MAG: methylenetetrahydrofolate reductase [Armatimonadota bacterium]
MSAGQTEAGRTGVCGSTVVEQRHAASFRDVLASGEFIVTMETTPPKGTDLEPVLAEAEACWDRVDAFTVTDNQSSNMSLGALVLSLRLKERGLLSVLQMSCRDRNRLALQSDLLAGAHLGITDIMCLTGDHVVMGDHEEAMPVFDLDSVTLLQVARGLMDGHDMVGNELKGPAPRFTLGAAVSPCSDPLEPQLLKLEKKVAAGAEFIYTQAVYDMDRLRSFMDEISHLDVPIMGGFCFLKSARGCQFMNDNLAGVSVPQALIDRFDKCDTSEARLECSIEISVELIAGMEEACRGVHLMPLGWERHVPTILDAAGRSGSHEG